MILWSHPAAETKKEFLTVCSHDGHSWTAMNKEKKFLKKNNFPIWSLGFYLIAIWPNPLKARQKPIPFFALIAPNFLISDGRGAAHAYPPELPSVGEEGPPAYPAAPPDHRGEEGGTGEHQHKEGEYTAQKSNMIIRGLLSRQSVSIDWWSYTTEVHILIIALPRDWQRFKWFTPSSWGQQVVILI